MRWWPCGLALLVLWTGSSVVEVTIETLPDPLRGYFLAHRRELGDWVVEPDTVLKESYGRSEAVKHFIDLDLYGSPPFADLPRSYSAAVRRFGRPVVEERGTVPWTIEQEHARLARKLRADEWRAALRAAAYAGHYVADARQEYRTRVSAGRSDGHRQSVLGRLSR